MQVGGPFCVGVHRQVRRPDQRPLSDQAPVVRQRHRTDVAKAGVYCSGAQRVQAVRLYFPSSGKNPHSSQSSWLVAFSITPLMHTLRNRELENSPAGSPCRVRGCGHRSLRGTGCRQGRRCLPHARCRPRDRHRGSPAARPRSTRRGSRRLHTARSRE